MNRLPRLKLFGTVCLLLCMVRPGPGAAEDLKAIHPTGYVTDLAGSINSQTKLHLEEMCTELEQKTGAQMAVVTVHAFEGESVENYAVDLYKHLGIGDKKEKRGVLLLVSPDERKYRIEVGYGLEPVINDARAGDAGRSMVPFLRRGDYSAAVETAAWQLAKYIADDRGVTLSNQLRPVPSRRTGKRDNTSRIWLPLALVVFFSLWRLFATSSRGRRGGGSWWMGSAGGLGGGGWTGGGFGGSSGGDSGGGFGGFGGGDSGGGGASGSW